MRHGLLIIRNNNLKKCSAGKSYHFTVVNLDHLGHYPENFVCILPLHIDPIGKPNEFTRILGDKSFQMAEKLLKAALRTEQDAGAKKEIERRLSLLEPQPRQNKCISCGKLLQTYRVRKYSQNFCKECRKKRYGSVT